MGKGVTTGYVWDWGVPGIANKSTLLLGYHMYTKYMLLHLLEWCCRFIRPTPRGRVAPEGGGRINRQHHDKRCDKIFIAWWNGSDLASLDSLAYECLNVLKIDESYLTLRLRAGSVSLSQRYTPRRWFVDLPVRETSSGQKVAGYSRVSLKTIGR